MSASPMGRPGFTLVEVIVTLAIIGALAVLAMMGVQAARETARRAQCVSNLRQIGLAMNAYQAREGMLPPEFLPGPVVDGFARSTPFSPFPRILPELDQPALFHALNFEVWGLSAENRTVQSTPLAVLVCPSDGAPRLPDTAPNNYRSNTGSGIMALGGPAAGAFETFRGVCPADFRDGAAFTALVAEKSRGDGSPDRWAPQRDFWFAGLDGPITTDAMVARCSAVPRVPPPHHSWAGGTWLYCNYLNADYNHASGPNATIPDCSTSDPGQGGSGYDLAGGGVFAARSLHGASVNLVAGDGSARSVRDVISLPVWRAFGTRSGGEAAASWPD